MSQPQSIADRIMITLLPPVAAMIIRFIGRTSKVEISGVEHVEPYWQSKRGVILSTWHDQLLTMPYWYSGPGAKILISASKDGELIARTIQKFGHEAIRGSSSRGGKEALRRLVQLGKESFDLAITPDGPRGPRHQLKAGVAQMAKLTGRPVIPMAFVCNRGHRFKSWDKFLLPYPFGRGVCLYGEPVFSDRDETFEAFMERLQEAMNANLKNAQEKLENLGASAI